MLFKAKDIARVQYEDRFKQPLLFDGMTFDKIYPTDIDAITEYHNWFFVIMEVKGEGAPLTHGQTTALVRLTDTIEQSGKTAILFICRHHVEDKSKPIFLKDTEVTEAYYHGQWETLSSRSALDAWEYAMHWAKRKEERGEVR